VNIRPKAALKIHFFKGLEKPAALEAIRVIVAYSIIRPPNIDEA
jgi:hypothetical protein